MQRFLLLCLASVAASAPCSAATQAEIPNDLQQEAMTCVSEAMQICPDLMTSEDHGLACMTGRRASFSPRCRVVYDKVDRALRASPPAGRAGAQHDRDRAPIVR